jgi:hypothetical protein
LIHFNILNFWSSHAFLVFDMRARYKKFFFRENYKADQIDQNFVSLLSIRRKLIVQYCLKVDHFLKLQSWCTWAYLLACESLNLEKYNTSKASKDDQLWDSTVQSVFVWLIKAKRDFDQLDQLYNFHEKKIFLMRAHAEYKRYAREKKFFFTRKYLFSVGYPRVE